MSNFMKTDISATLRVSTMRNASGFESLVQRLATADNHSAFELESRKCDTEQDAITAHAELVACWTVKHITGNV